MKGLTGATSSSGSNPSNTIAQTGLCKLSGEALSIGTWRRVALAPEDLDCKINLLEKSVRWQIMESGSRFKIEFPLQSVSSLKFETTDGISGQITAELIQAPQFFMEIVNMSAGNPTWTQCRDFTEGHQATTIFRHVLRGSASAMQEELMALASADPYLQGIIQIASIQGKE